MFLYILNRIIYNFIWVLYIINIKFHIINYKMQKLNLSNCLNLISAFYFDFCICKNNWFEYIAKYP